MQGVDLPELFEEVNTSAMMDIIEYIVSADVVDNANYDDNLHKSRANINTTESNPIGGTDTSGIKKTDPSEYIQPTDGGYPGLMAPLG